MENYLQYSEYEYQEYSSSNHSSHVHSEQVGSRGYGGTYDSYDESQMTAPIKKKTGINHSFSEPDLARLMTRSPKSPRNSPRRRRGGLPWHK